ncbi:alpha/beta-type small acid-soluble spore protein [Ammoniphilus sp. CFH 90114]|uniref:alpha/beta-type small acid-soluble spore protein n=1 Tax=Ammoniphilus sp. CFH 90114 TaxID=2493665 RepID=UPI00100ED865|nr:alpha/beta-type small acid-soluble spore protein [Ammoniphilus sp. CFH 90114]RXT07096.1 alpha/beta-type small acid-soluble spore protein [Ammoniphilus sp. CFH 90114]
MKGQMWDQFKNETAAELGVPNYDGIDKGLLPSRVNGMVGGMMVRKMINLAEEVMANQGLNETMMNDHSVSYEDQNRVTQTLQQAQVIPAYQMPPQESFDQQQLH